MRVWAALAVLAATLTSSGVNGAQTLVIGGIEFVVRNEPHPKLVCDGESAAIYTVAKFRPMSRCASACGKNIIVFDPAPEQYGWANIFDQSCASHLIGAVPVNVWPNQSVTEQIRTWKIKVVRCLAFKTLQINIGAHINCGCLTTIFKDDRKFVSMDSSGNFGSIAGHCAWMAMLQPMNIGCGDVSAQLLFGVNNSDLIAGNCGPGGLDGSLDRRLHVCRLLIGGASQTGGFGGQPGSRVEQANCESSQDAVEKNEQPIRRMVQKGIVPVAFLLSFLGLFWAARSGGRIGGLAVLLCGFGWLALIIYFGLLHLG